MPSKTDFNVSPYFDDFTEDKKFHRVMYRPAYAVQARELTTQQSITQNQIEKMSDSMFKHGAMVVAGEANYDLNYYAVKLTSFTGTLANYKDATLTGGTSGLVADVIGFVATDGTDPDTLFVKYRNSGTDNATVNWGATATADHYALRARVAGTSTWTTNAANIYGTSKTMYGLTDGTIYEWQLRSVCSYDTSSVSAWSSLQTFTTFANCNAKPSC